jgi:putative transposase
VKPELSPDIVRRRLTSLFPAVRIEDIARERDVVQRDRKLDITMFVWTLIAGFAAGGEARSIAAYRRSYNIATGHNLFPSSFYDRFTDGIADLLGDLLDLAVEEVAVPHHLAPAFDRFRDVIAVDATIVRLHRFLSAFPATHEGVSGLQLYLVHHVTEQSVISAEITDERTHESTLFKTGSWMRGRLFLLDLGFFKYRRFALIDENDGFFVSRLKRSANPLITEELEEWRGRAIPLVGKHVFDIVGDLHRKEIDVTVEVSVKRRPYGEKQSVTPKQFRVVGVRDEDADDGDRVYMTNLPSTEFTPAEVSALYRARWSVELLFRELKSRYELGSFQTEKPHIVRIQVLAALLTLVVSRAILRVFVDHAEDCGDGATFPPERWATTFRSIAQLVLLDIAESYGYPPPDLSEFLYLEAQQPAPSRMTLLGEVSAELCSGF